MDLDDVDAIMRVAIDGMVVSVSIVFATSLERKSRETS
jgi:hypothetical protein